jgi:hypothetical protein
MDDAYFNQARRLLFAIVKESDKFVMTLTTTFMDGKA